ncbi:uncharacterized protein TRAVEDRAFT_57633 [Trametes versicolor FP-101664 SS1]|uniref:uncharacterized protein n=1 Tax=Trametes versicolor (strain FP-101664) TaxID=717944 RepID=UPI0004622046|nr:uncharacterized protein TRAVEDRAFT_57633 [Trametes versicolor FP-101664 SS1]EIW60349.1 hypothetical protein TRAVEDRAFT_57633 [Trametes versicolor FP-101664 SS1]
MPLHFNGFSAHISCDDTELEIFSAQEDDEMATGWIASEVLKEFKVHWGEETGDIPFIAAIYTDGNIAQRMQHRTGVTGDCRGVYVSSSSIRPFTFSDLILTDDDAIINTKNVSDKLGSIEVILTRVERFEPTKRPYVGRYGFTEIGPVHEKSKKAGVHTVTLGEMVQIEPQTTCETVGRETESCAHFLFRYRPIELLRANGIAPQVSGLKDRSHDVEEPGAPGPSDPKRKRKGPAVKSETLSDDEDDEEDEKSLEEQLALLQGRLEKKRAKKAQALVKREMSPIRVPFISDDEVIDLT